MQMLIDKPGPYDVTGNWLSNLFFFLFFFSFYSLHIKHYFYSSNSCNCFHLVQEKKAGER